MTNNKQGAALAKVLGDGPVALMRGHGNLVVAGDIPRVVHRALYTEVNAQQLATALSFSRPIKYVAAGRGAGPQAPRRFLGCVEGRGDGREVVRRFAKSTARSLPRWGEARREGESDSRSEPPTPCGPPLHGR